MTKHRETVQDVMTSDPIMMPASASILAAAQKMRSAAIGDVLVLDDDGEKILGIVTDRDMVVRGIAEGLDPRVNLRGERHQYDAGCVLVEPGDDSRPVGIPRAVPFRLRQEWGGLPKL